MIRTTIPKGHEAAFLRAKRRFLSRGSRSIEQDLSQEADRSGLIDDSELVESWSKHPNEYDIAGIDDPLYGPQLMDLDLLKQMLGRKVGDIKESVKRTVEEAKEKVRKVSMEKVPPERKAEEIRKVKADAVEKIEREIRPQIAKIRQIVAKVRTRRSLSWSDERRKRAGYVAGTVKCGVIEADALIRRVKLKGKSYDEIDWDQMQGGDLSFDDRLSRLESQIGSTYTEDEYEGYLSSMRERCEEYLSRAKEAVARGEECVGGQYRKEFADPTFMYEVGE